jgi:hypothetical protein
MGQYAVQERGIIALVLGTKLQGGEPVPSNVLQAEQQAYPYIIAKGSAL